MKEVSFKILRCNSKASAESFATLVKQSQTVNPGFFILDSAHWILIKGEIRIEGWVAIRISVEHILATLGRRISVKSEWKVMAAGRREDMRAIWDKVWRWDVTSDFRLLFVFTKNYDGEKGGWEGVEG